MTARQMTIEVRQVGLYAPDPDKLAAFYQTTLGLHIVGQGERNADRVRKSILLNNRSDVDQHQVIIYADPGISHVAFELESLADLQRCYQKVVDHDLPIRWVLNHGVALAFYFDDPAGNLIKLYWSTGERYPQPHGHPIDLSQSEATLRQDVIDLVAHLKHSNGD